MDPVTRSEVWKMIERAKRGRVIILTTHSMEEVEALCTKMGIMVKGEFKCFEPATHIKDKYGTG